MSADSKLRDTHPVRRHNTVYRCETPDPSCSLVFGNGVVGGSVRTVPDGIELVICRNDNWNASGGQKAAAVVRITAPGFSWKGSDGIRQTCCLADAEIVMECGQGDRHAAFRVLAPRGCEVVMVLTSGIAWRWEAVVHPVLEDDESREAGGWSGIFHCNAKSCYAEGNRRVGLEESFGRDPIKGRRWAVAVPCEEGFPGQGFVIATALLDPETAGDPWQLACETGTKVRNHSASCIEDHRNWWAGFWGRSHLEMHSRSGDAEYEERVWYTNLYFLGSACGGDFPPRFNGGLFLLDPVKRDWDYGYWFQNMREIYWPLFATGHADWIRSFFGMYLGATEYARAQTRSVHGWGSPAFPETMSFWGWSPDTDLPSRKFASGVHHNFSSNLEVCLLMDWYARWSGDHDFRDEVFYPFLRSAVGLFREIGERGDDGLFHFAPCNALEVWVDAIDPAQDIAGLRVLVPRLIEMGRKLGADRGEISAWEDFLDGLPPLPVGQWVFESRPAEGIHTLDDFLRVEQDSDGIYLPAGGLAGTNRRRCNMENAELYAVFPWGLIPRPGDPADARRVERTWHHRTWKRRNNGWSQDVPQLARMGNAEWAAQASLEHASHNQRFPNGGFICPGSPRFHGLLTPHLYLDSAGVHLAGIAEMCLQSFDGIIRIAPALPPDWDVSFAFHTLDGFLVEAEIVGGSVVSAKVIGNGRPGSVVIRNTRKTPMRVRTSHSTLFVKAGSDFCGEPEDGIFLHWDEAFRDPVDPRPSEMPEVIYPGYKVTPPPVSHPSGHWHDERGCHGQIGLSEDGLFPAIRSK